MRARLTALRDDVQRAVKRFELENQGLDAVGQRIVDMRGGLTLMEGRFKQLEESSRGIHDVHSKADGLVTQLEGIARTWRCWARRPSARGRSRRARAGSAARSRR